jgi:uncharacterized protein (DUF305 family)
MNRIVPVTRALALASLVALIATALAQGMNHGPNHGAATPPGVTSAPMGMGMGMGMSMATQTVDEASFLVHMIPHHREAVASAEALRAVTERPELRALAAAIITTQSTEIEAMEGWLAEWRPTVDRDVAYVPMMRDLGPDAAVADVERAFLEDMIGHHMMAVHEAQTLLVGGLAEHAEVAELARSIVAGQMTEMHQMAAWLGAWFGVDATMGMGVGVMGMGQPQVPGAPSMGMGPGVGDQGMGMGMGMAGGMHGAGGGHGAMHESMHGSMHGGAAAAPAVGSDEVERLVRAFLAGQGIDASTATLEATSLVYEVTVRVGGATQVLRVDAATGAVEVAPAR